MLVHFICTGNAFRSRLAEAYFKSKDLENVKVISSGIAAHNNLSGPICWQTQRIIEINKLIEFQSDKWQQTTRELLDKSDLIVFMKYSHLEWCERELGYKGSNHKILDVNDLTSHTDKWLFKPKKDTLLYSIKMIKASKKKFQEIKSKVDALHKELF